MSFLKKYYSWIVLAFAFLLPFAITRKDYLSILVMALIYIILAIGLNIVVGNCGLLALGFAAFYGIGAYITAVLTVKLGFTILPVLFFVLMGSILAGLICGLPVIRLKGDYLAIVTLGFGEICRILFNNVEILTNGPKGISGIPNPALFGLTLKTPFDFYYLLLLSTVIILIFVKNLNNSRIGRAWIAIREDEVAASSIGINIIKLKLFAFVLGSTIAGFAGFLFAQVQTFVSPDSFTFLESAMVLSAIVLGGIGSLPGIILGSLILALLPEILRDIMPGFAEYRMLVFGGLLISMMLFRPQGIIADKRRKSELMPITGNIKLVEDESLEEDRKY